MSHELIARSLWHAQASSTLAGSQPRVLPHTPRHAARRQLHHARTVSGRRQRLSVVVDDSTALASLNASQVDSMTAGKALNQARFPTNCALRSTQWH